MDGSVNTQLVGLGLPRTGTTSMSYAAWRLGYTTCHNPQSVEHLLRYQAVWEMNAAACYRYFERVCQPRYVVLYRELESWLDSCERRFADHWDKSRHRFPRFALLFGCWEFDREFFAETHRWWYERMAEWTRHIGLGRVLWMNLEAGDGWEPLCRFLGVEEPDEEFPRLTKR